VGNQDDVESRNLPPQVAQQCIDAATDKMMNSIGGEMRQGKCSKQDMQKVGNTLVVDSVCEIAGMTTTSHAVISGDFNSGYSVKVTSKRSGGPAIPGMPADGTTNMSIETKWLSACKGDQKPGDMIMADGRKINIVDMQNMMPPNMRGADRRSKQRSCRVGKGARSARPRGTTCHAPCHQRDRC